MTPMHPELRIFSRKISCENINKKNIRNRKAVYLHEESLFLLVNAYKKTCTSNRFLALSRLHATAVDCLNELINRESGIKVEVGKIPQN